MGALPKIRYSNADSLILDRSTDSRSRHLPFHGAAFAIPDIGRGSANKTVYVCTSGPSRMYI